MYICTCVCVSTSPLRPPQVLSSTGEHILPYADHVLACLSKCVQLKAIPVYTNTAIALQTMLRSLSFLYPVEGRTVNVDYSVPPEEHCYIRVSVEGVGGMKGCGCACMRM